ncbi:MAG: glycosyltransferase [Acidobacteria bacterium]|nr:glycosyltransferase [Acidobacteriota bacterium]MBV9435513.1 glycosyltransferase [Acidobacteriota bacterium]
MLALACLTLAIWTYLLCFHGKFWRLQHIRLAETPGPPSEADTSEPATIAAIIPARDEAELIGRAVSSLLRQEFTGKLHVFVVDDNSSDGTANVARAVAARLGAAEKLTVIPGLELLPGWTGKVLSMHQGWLAAREIKPDYILFTDADIEHGAGTLRRLLANIAGYDLVSLMVRLRTDNLREKFLIPAFVYFFFLLYPPAKIADTRSRAAGAAGGCILLRSEILEKIGGLDKIAGELIDDCALAKLVKGCRGHLWLGVTQQTRSIRPYGTLGSIRDMIARTAFNQLHYSSLLLLACVAGMLLTFVAPLALVWSSNAVAAWLALAACFMMFASYLPILRLYRINLLAAVALPFAAIFYTYATIVSAYRHWRHRGGEWKGRKAGYREQGTGYRGKDRE